MPYLNQISVHNKKGRVNLTLPLLFVLSGRPTFYAERGHGTPATPSSAALLTSRGHYEAATTTTTASAGANTGVYR